MNTRDLWGSVRLKRNVVGFSGVPRLKISDGREQRVLSFRVYVKEKLPVEELRAFDLIPRAINGIPTDIIEVGEMKALSCEDTRKQLHRPAPAGVSAIFEGGSACTLGWFARDHTDGDLVIIANNHCTADENRNKIGHPYVQPSPYDGKPVFLGKLKRYVPIDFGEYICSIRQFLTRAMNPFYAASYNRVDLGIVSVDDEDVAVELLCVGKLNGKRAPVLNEKLMKFGRTTGWTRDGLYVDDQFFGEVGYSRGSAQFGPVGLIAKEGFSDGGDSSSAIITQSDRFFSSLLFAGSTTHTLFCHLKDIEELGQVTVIT